MEELNEIEIEVTGADIRAGSPGNPCKCPVARAIQRKFPGYSASVGHTIAALSKFDENRTLEFYGRYAIPVEVEKVIAAFDRGIEMKPFKFSLTKMQPNERHRRELRPGNNEHYLLSKS